MKIKTVSKETFDELISSDDRHFVYFTLKELCGQVSSEEDALRVSLLKWVILKNNRSLTIGDYMNIGATPETCGLCAFFERKTRIPTPSCLKCHEFTHFSHGTEHRCFRDYFSWIEAAYETDDEYVLKDVTPDESYELAGKVHKLLYLRLEEYTKDH